MTKKADDLYASPTPDLEVARQLLEKGLQISLSMHDSSWRGGDYFMGSGMGNETYILQRNRIGKPDAAEEQFQDVETILYVECTTRSSELLETLQEMGFRRLRHKEK
jgi:hypothetical protein